MTTKDLVTKYNRIFHTDYTQDANCVGAWLFTEGSGTQVDDSSSNSNVGNFASNGHPAWGSMSGTYAPTYAPYMVDFVASSEDKINYADDTSLNISGNITFMSWVNFTSLPTSGGYQTILSKQYISSPESIGYFLDIYHNGSSVLARGGSYNGSSYMDQSTLAGRISIDEWHHLAVYYDGSAWVILIDGVQYDGLTQNTGAISSSGALTAGWINPIARYLNAKVTEQSVFNTNLSSTEINDIIDNGLVGGAAPTTTTTTFAHMTCGKFWGYEVAV
jgi:hypothetical protein